MSKPRPQKPDPIMNISSSYFHYGFIVLAVATVGKVFSSPGQSPCIGVIIEEVRLDVNITRSTLTGYYFAATTTSALLLPLGGKLIDRFGPRKMVTVFASGLGFACFFISWVTWILRRKIIIVIIVVSSHFSVSHNSSDFKIAKWALLKKIRLEAFWAGELTAWDRG